MNIALLGYGNMGKEIERVVTRDAKHSITSISYSAQYTSLDTTGIGKADVVIDFTSPEIVLENIKAVLQIGTPIVVGTTGWYSSLSVVERLVREHNGSLIYGQNFSVGANIFFQIVAYATSLIDAYEGYDIFGVETHHVGKKDSPSGTTKTLAKIILQNSTQKKVLQHEALDRQIRKEELHFASVRGGRNFGKHEVAYDSQADEIRLTHQAWSREGFAQGAILAAEFIKGKKGIHDFQTLFQKEISL
jgi:4-hydroxy-tetrahydrodipicolinate reductase